MIYFRKLNINNVTYLRGNGFVLWSDLPKIMEDVTYHRPGELLISARVALKLFQGHPAIYEFLRKVKNGR